jgi:hypothetical protein
MTLVQPPVWLTWRSGWDKNAVGSTAGQALPAFPVGSDFAIGRPIRNPGRTIDDRVSARPWPRSLRQRIAPLRPNGRSATRPHLSSSPVPTGEILPRRRNPVGIGLDPGRFDARSGPMMAATRKNAAVSAT